MKQKTILRYFILIYWIIFNALTVIDKIIPDVYPLWVGADFYTLFVKLFASLGITNPIFATISLAGTALLETIVLAFYIFSFINLYKGREKASEKLFFRGVSLSVLVFVLFSIGDQVFGDRSNLLEHSIFIIILIVSFVIFKYQEDNEKRTKSAISKNIKIVFLAGLLLTVITSYSIFDFSKKTYPDKTKPVNGIEVVQGVYKFDFPFLADKITLEKTITEFENKHPELKINYIYTAPDELHTKKKTHMLLYVFTEPKN